jgi:ATP-dependent DNA helicase RecG
LGVVFFNQPWREKQLREGLQVALFGKAEVYRGGLQMTNPVVDLIGDRTGRIVPVLSAEREGRADDVGDRRVGRGRVAQVWRREASPTRYRNLFGGATD